ncbi:hypothetical protein [Rhodovulum steppense]|uniref:Uncharacterized protein n=1 Tax=Rhodovulum steppense TaxID=540251 RepID=A0A4R1YUL3_9RHOB|nr:hypothetical protein [Rhodovulum steppense]TCM84788.1 hypothetical protein EV216_110106 [Rhodovulum steppense]
MAERVSITLIGRAKVDGQLHRALDVITVSPVIAAQLRAAGVVAPEQNTQRGGEDSPEPQGARAEPRLEATGEEPAPAGEAAASPAPKSRPRKARATKG